MKETVLKSSCFPSLETCRQEGGAGVQPLHAGPARKRRLPQDTQEPGEGIQRLPTKALYPNVAFFLPT